MEPISPEEKELLEENWRPVRIGRQDVFPSFACDGTPRKELRRLYSNADGNLIREFPAGEKTQAELDAMPLRNSNGMIMPLTYGEYRKGVK